MVSAGRVLLMPKGEYDATTPYSLLDLVSYNGSSYVAKKSTTGNLPTNTTYWQLSAYGGSTANLAGNFAYLETTDYASNPDGYRIGDFLVTKDSQFCKVTAPITVGDELVIGTTGNLKTTDVGELIQEVISYADGLDAKNVKLQGMTAITAQTDLDDMTTIGNYYKSATNFYVTNAPTGIASELTAIFRLTVENGSDTTNKYIQTLRTNDGKTYTRGYNGSAWGDWIEEASAASVSALNTSKQPKTLDTPITVGDTQQTTVEGTLGALNSDLSNKYDKSGGTLTGDVLVDKTSTTGRTAIVAKQVNSSTGNNLAEFYANSEGGNIRLTKGNDTAHMELDTNDMNGSNGFVRLYLGKSGSELVKQFKFREDGNFVDGNGINSGYTIPFMPIFATSPYSQGSLADALAIDASNAFGSTNRVGYCYSGYSNNIPEDFVQGTREVYYYNSSQVLVKLTGKDTTGLYGEWGNTYNGTGWSGWQRLNSKIRFFHGNTSATTTFNGGKLDSVLAYIFDKGTSKRVCNISVVNSYDTWYLLCTEGLLAITLNNGNPAIFRNGENVTATLGYEITATDANNYVLKIPTARRVLLFMSQASITLN